MSVRRLLPTLIMVILIGSFGFSLTGVTAISASGQAEACLACHTNATPGIVEGWQKSRHSEIGVNCLTCHEAMEGDPSAFEHNGFTITAVVSPNYCAKCHTEEVEENARSKHAFAAINGPLKLYYKAAKEQGLDPFAQETAKQLDPMEIARRALTPLFPDSGILKKIGILDDADYNHENVLMTGCMECHGTFVIADGSSLIGWPNNGIGRINPDGSLGSCAACHTRHTFSRAEARKPDTCGQCHLGPDHPQIEIYLESKHGNLYLAMGDEWNWEAKDWGPDDITAPTCATCHMSGFGGVVETTHDVGARLKWEIQAEDVMYQSRESNLAEFGFVPMSEEGAQQNRARMLKVCTQCHSSSWAEGYLAAYERTLRDYQRVWDYTEDLLQQAYDEGLMSAENPIDERGEILAYLVWHHSGRRWRMGAAMMGPDYTHWHGAVETIMTDLAQMIDWIDTQRQLRALGLADSNGDVSSESAAAQLLGPKTSAQAPLAGLLGPGMITLALGVGIFIAARRRTHLRSHRRTD